MTNHSILITTPYFYPRTGGLENYAYHVARGLEAAGWRVIVACGDTDITTPTKHVKEGITIYRLPVAKVVSNTPINLRWYRMLKTIIRTERPDVINAHTPVPFMVDITALASGRTPLVITYHAATLVKPSNPLLAVITQLYLIIQKATFRRARRIIAVSDYVKEALGAKLAPKVAIVLNAVPAAAPVTNQLGHGLVFIANLEPSHHWKGLELIIAALGHIKTTGRTPPHLTIIGDGSSREKYEQQVKTLGLEQSIAFAGRKTGHERDALMRKAAALIAYPTTANDALPTVFLEAWAQGLAIIAAGIGPIPSLIKNGHTGQLVRPNDPQALANAIVTLFQHPTTIKQMGLAGRQLIATTYNWPTQITNTIAVLEHLL